MPQPRPITKPDPPQPRTIFPYRAQTKILGFSGLDLDFENADTRQISAISNPSVLLRRCVVVYVAVPMLIVLMVLLPSTRLGQRPGATSHQSERARKTTWLVLATAMGDNGGDYRKKNIETLFATSHGTILKRFA